MTEDPCGALAAVTNYRYDTLDDLTDVCQGGSFDTNGACQGGRSRSYTYDALKRLKAAANPESGTILYEYDNDGNLLTRQDAGGWLTCYGTLSGTSCADGYDALERPTAKTYGKVGTPDGGKTRENSGQYTQTQFSRLQRSIAH